MSLLRKLWLQCQETKTSSDWGDFLDLIEDSANCPCLFSELSHRIQELQHCKQFRWTEDTLNLDLVSEIVWFLMADEIDIVRHVCKWMNLIIHDMKKRLAKLPNHSDCFAQDCPPFPLIVRTQKINEPKILEFLNEYPNLPLEMDRYDPLLPATITHRVTSISMVASTSQRLNLDLFPRLKTLSVFVRRGRSKLLTGSNNNNNNVKSLFLHSHNFMNDSIPCIDSTQLSLPRLEIVDLFSVRWIHNSSVFTILRVFRLFSVTLPHPDLLLSHLKECASSLEELDLQEIRFEIRATFEEIRDVEKEIVHAISNLSHLRLLRHFSMEPEDWKVLSDKKLPLNSIECVYHGEGTTMMDCLMTFPLQGLVRLVLNESDDLNKTQIESIKLLIQHIHRPRHNFELLVPDGVYLHEFKCHQIPITGQYKPSFFFLEPRIEPPEGQDFIEDDPASDSSEVEDEV